MAKSVFFSYAREDLDSVAHVAETSARVGFTAFFDQDIVGGQQWWDRLLTEIEACDVFVPALSSYYLRSGPCRIEVSYAVELGKTIIPLDLGAGQLVGAAFIEPIKAAQWIPYDDADRSSAVLRLVAAVNSAPTAPPLPDGVKRPAAPGADVLATAVRLVGSPGVLTETEQWAVMGELRANMRGEHGAASRALLESFLTRRDLLATVYEDAKSMMPASPAAPPTPPSAPPVAQAPQPRRSQSPQAAHHLGEVRPTLAPPRDVAGAPPGRKPASYTAWSIVMIVVGVVLLFASAFLSFFTAVCGVIALVNAVRVDRLWASGGYHAARSASRRAVILNSIAVVFAVVSLVVSVAFFASDL